MCRTLLLNVLYVGCWLQKDVYIRSAIRGTLPTTLLQIRALVRVLHIFAEINVKQAYQHASVTIGIHHKTVVYGILDRDLALPT